MRAGWSQTDITPPLGLPMGGRGPRFAPGVEVLDPLSAQALVLEDDAGRRTLWVSLDLIGVEREMGLTLRWELAALTGVPLERVIVNYAHIHSGPMINFDGYATVVEKPPGLAGYGRELQHRVARAGLEAVAALRPARIALHRGESEVGINRRGRDASGQMTMRPDPAGAHNPDLWVLDVQAADGRHAVIFNYGCHPVIVYGFAWQALSAGWPGAARRALAGALGADTHCQFIQGLAGNVRPRVLADLEAGHFRKSQPEDVETAGRQMAADVQAALGNTGNALELELAGTDGWFNARRDQTAIPDIDHWRRCAASEDELERNRGRYWLQRLDSGLPPVQCVPWAVGLLRLTRNHTVGWMAGEVLAEWLPLLRQCLPTDLTMFGYCQYVAGYLPTDALLPEGGYEVASSPGNSKNGPGPLAPGLDAAVQQTVRGLARQLDLEAG